MNEKQIKEKIKECLCPEQGTVEDYCGYDCFEVVNEKTETVKCGACGAKWLVKDLLANQGVFDDYHGMGVD